MTAYYNEHDPFAAAWLRELIKDGLIAPGDVDERDIQDVTPNDLTAYTQVHCFAGIGGWSFALRLAGWPDTRPVWTGSAPCQPFSDAGAGGGFADERHLWPAWFWLIRQCRPVTIFGEQVSSRAGLAWWDVVATDLEAAGYGCGAFDLCAAGAGAFHIRQRLYFVADAQSLGGREGQPNFAGGEKGSGAGQRSKFIDNGSGELADSPGKQQRGVRQRRSGDGWEQLPDRGHGPAGGFWADSEWLQCKDGKARPAEPGVFPAGVALANALGAQEHKEQQRPAGDEGKRPSNGTGGRGVDSQGFWSTAEWILCRDGKARPVEPGIQPLAHGVPNRVGTLRGAGNAIVPQLAAKFISAYLEAGHSWQ